MKEKKNILENVAIPDGVHVQIAEGKVTIKGPKGEFFRDLKNPKVNITVEENIIKVSAVKSTKRELTIVGAFVAHLKNMMRGVIEPHIYRLKICSGHFPITVTATNRQLIIKNFLGEKFPRTLTIKPGVDVKVEGDTILIESINKELAGQTAADIENITHITNRDRRIFQDGIYIIMKDGKHI